MGTPTSRDLQWVGDVGNLQRKGSDEVVRNLEGKGELTKEGKTLRERELVTASGAAEVKTDSSRKVEIRFAHSETRARREWAEEKGEKGADGVGFYFF